MWRWVTLQQAKAFVPDNSAQIVKLPLSQKISAVRLYFTGQNGTTSGNQLLRDVFNNVTVFGDGHIPIVISNVFQLSALQLINQRRHTYINETSTASATQEAIVYVTFGRRFYDSEFYLEPSGFRDLELRVNANPTISATGFQTGTLTLKVDALVADTEDVAPNRGVIAPIIRENKVSVANSAYTFTLPPAGQVRRILLMLTASGNLLPTSTVSTVRLTANDDSLVLYDDTAVNTFYQNIAEVYPLEMLESADTSGRPGVRQPISSFASFVYFAFNQNDTPESYLDLARFKNVRLSVKEGLTSGVTYSLVLERFLSLA